MPFPLEMRGFPPVIFNKSIKNSLNMKLKVMEMEKSAFHQIKNQRI